MATTKVFLQLEPVWGRYDPDRVAGMTVAAMTKKRPKNAAGPVVELTLNVPDAAFLPLRPAVTIDVPEGALDFEPVMSIEMAGDVIG